MVTKNCDKRVTYPAMDCELIEQWRRCLHELPNVRWAKISAVRAALKRNTYDLDTLLDEALEPLGEDLGMLTN